MERELLTIQEAADFFGVTTKTLRRWESKGLLLPQRTAGNQRRYSRDQLLAFQDSKSLEEPVTPLTDSIASQLSLPQLPLPVKQGFLAAKKRSIFFIAGGFASLALLAIALLALSQASSNDADKLAESLRTTGKALNVKLGNEQKIARPQSASNNAVLGASKFSPTFNYTVSVPSTFKDTVKLKSTLDVSGLATFSANITAPNILYGVTAGTGINVGSGQNPVISNTGVLSLQGQTGALAFTAGNGIAFNGLTIENNDRGSDQKIFQNFVVGDKTLTAGSNKDSLQFLAGSGISLGADTSGNKITITGLSPGGWTTGSGTVYATNTTDSVGIGTTNPSSFKLQVAGNVGPDANNSYDLGSSSLQWRNIYAGTSLTVSSDTVSDLTGAGLTLSSGTLALDLLTSADGTGSTSNFSGLELKNNHLTLLQGCSNNQLLKWDDGNNVWACSNDLGGTGSSINVAEGASTYSGIDTVNFNQNDFDVTQNTTTVTVTLDNTLARFRLNNGAVYAANSTTDLLLGGSATSSAKLAFININTGTPTASISANNGNNATYIAGDGTLATTNSQTLTLGGSTTGNIILSPNNGNNKVTSTGSFNLSNGKTFQINNIDVLSDSTLGTGVITSSLTTVGALNAGSITSGFGAIDIGNDNLSSSGTITFGAFTANGGLLYTNGSGVLAQTTVGSGGQCLISNGGGAPTWGACNTPITNFWQLNSGALSPSNSTVDLLIGATATSSAKFAVINVDSGTPTASLSAGTNGGSYLTADGTLATTAEQTLTLGSATTGTVALNPNNGNNKVTSTGTLNLSSGKTFQINNSDVLSSTTLGNTVISSSLTTVGTIGTGVWNGTVIGSQFGGTGLNTSAATGVPTIASGTWSVAASLSPNLGGTGLTSYATGDLIYASGANTLANRTIGNSGDILTVTGGVPTWTASNAILFWQRSSGTVEPSNITDDLLLGSTATSSAKFAFFNVAAGTPTASVSAGTSGAVYITADGTLATTAEQNLTLGNATTGTITLNPNGGNNKVSSTGTVNVASGKTYQINNADVLSNTTLGSSVVSSSLTSVGTIATGVWNGTVIGAQFGGTGLNTSVSTGVPTIASGTWSVSASLGPTLGGTGLTSYNQGDIIYASAANTLSNLGIGGTNTCLTSNGTVPSWSSCASSQYWQLNAGALSPFSNTADLLLGGTATASAKFAFVNVNSGTPTASISAGTTGAIYFDATGKLATTAKQNLTLGDTNTGNIILNGGSVGIGTATPATALDVVGRIQLSSGGNQVIQSTGSMWLRTTTSSALHLNDANTGNVDIAGGGGNVGIGNSSPGSKLDVAGAVIGKALVSFNETGDQNILTASASGVTKLTLDRSGNLGLAAGAALDTLTAGSLTIGGTTQNALTLGRSGAGTTVAGSSLTLSTFSTDKGLLYTNGSGVVSQTAQGAANTVLHGNGSGAPTFSAVSLTADVTNTLPLGNGGTGFSTYTQGDLIYASATNTLSKLGIGGTGTCLGSNGTVPAWTSCAANQYWQLNAGTLSPFSNSADLLLGGTATASARFAFINVNSGTPVASVSAGTTGGTYLTADGKLATTAKQDLTLGDSSTTGNILINPSGNLGLGTTAPQYKFDVVGNAFQVRDAASATKAYRFRTTGSALDFEAGGADMYLSDWSNPDYTGTQNFYIRLESGAHNADLNGSWNFLTGNNATNPAYAIISESGITFNQQQATNLNFRVKGDNDTNTFLVDTSTDSVNIGTSTPLGKFQVNNAATGKALAIFNETGNQALLTASASGTTKFTIDHSGNILASGTISGLTGVNSSGTVTFSAFTNNGGLLYTDASGNLAQTTVGSGGQCLQSNGGGAPSWTSCSTPSANFWQLNNGTISPFSNTVDVLIGQTATSSAKFGFLNVNNGTPTASISANSGNNATYVTGTGTVATTNMQNMTIGGSTTGSITIDPGIGGITLGDVNTDRVTFNAQLLGGSPFVFQGATDNGFTTTFNVSDPTGNRTITLPNNSGTIALNTSGSATGGTSAFVQGGQTWATTATLGTQDSNALNLITNNSARLSIDATGNVGIGTTSQVSKLHVSGATTGKSLSIFDESGDQNILTASASGVTKLTLDRSGNVNLAGGAGLDTITAGSLTIGGTTQNALTLGRSGAGTTVAGSSLTLSTFNTDKGLLYTNGSGTVSQTAQGAANTVLHGNGSGAPTFSAVSLVNDITGTLGSGNGGTGFSTYTQGDLIYASATNILSKLGIGGTGTCLGSNGTVPAWTSCAANQYWQLNAGALSPFSNTADVLFGGTATASAKFAFINNTGAGTPTASVSAGTIGGVYLTAQGKLATTAKQNLTLGDTSTTGNVIINPSGNIGIGTTTASTKLYVNGDATVNGTLYFGADCNAGCAQNGGFETFSDMALIAHSAGKITFESDANIIATLLNNGNVGIGATNTTPVGKLDVSSAVTGKALTILNETGDQNILTASASGTSKFAVDRSGDIIVAAGAKLMPFTDSSTALNIANASGTTFASFDTTSQRVMIGNVAPVSKFHVDGRQTGKALAIFNYTGTDQNILVASVSGTTKFAVDFNGNLGIAGSAVSSSNYLTTPNFVLTTAGTITSGLWNGTAINAQYGGTGINTSAATGIPSISSGTWSVNASLGVTLGGTGTTTSFTPGSIIFAGSSGVYSQDNTQFFFDDTNNLFGIGTATPVGKLHATGAVTGKALTILNETGDQDIITGSSSGTTKFRITNSGDVYLYDSLRTQQNVTNVIDLFNNGIALESYLNASYKIDNDNNDTTENYSVLTNGGQSTLFYVGQSGNAGSSARPLVGFGIASPEHALHVNTATTGKALVSLNETGDQNILTASASGTTKFSLDRNGNLGIAGSTVSSSNYITAPNFSVTTGGLTTIGSNLVLSNSSATTTFGGIAYTWPTGGQVSGYALTTNGSGTLSWTDPVTLGSNWNVASGAISPKMASVVDLLLGSNATSSAKFAFKNVLTGTPTASISAGTNGAVYLDATGALATTAKQSLTFGDGNTGNLQFYSSSNTLTSAGDLTLAGDITINGGDIIGAATTNFLNAATTVNFGSTNVTRAINIGTGNNADTINIGTGTTTGDTIAIGGTAANTISVGNTQTGGSIAIGTALTTGTTTIGSTGKGTANGSNLLLPGGAFSQGAVTGKALAIFNETGDQNILSASQSGVAVFNLARVAGTAANGFTLTPATTGNNPTLAATGSDTNIGLNFSSKGTGSFTFNSGVTTGTTTGSGFVLSANAVNSGTAMYLTSSSVTTGKLLDINTAAANTLSSGTLLNIANSSSALTTGSLLSSAYSGTAAFTGNLNYFDWTPGSATTATGDIFRIHIGPNGNATNLFNIVDDTTSLFSVNETQITSAIPHQFTAAGDLGLAYDLQFTNQTSSYIKSNAPLYLETGESFESNDLTLRTFNSGNVIFDLSGNSSGTGGIGIGAGITPNSLFEISGRKTGKALVSLNETGNQAVLTASISGTTKFIIDNTGNAGVGTATPGYRLHVSDSQAATYSAMIENTNSGASTRGLAVKLGATSTGSTNRWIDFMNGNGFIVGKVIGNGTNTLTYSTNGADFAEYFRKEYPAEAIPAESLVCLGPTGGVTKCTTQYHNIIGIVSANAAFIGNGAHDTDPNYISVGMTGQLNATVTTDNGAIHAGDMLTYSTFTPGAVTKATTAGQVVGKAIDAYAIPGTGSVRIVVQPSWYDPDIYLTSSGDLAITQNGSTPNKYDLTNTDGSLVTRSGLFDNAAIANLNAGSVTAKKISLNGQSLIDLLAQAGQSATDSARLDDHFSVLDAKVSDLTAQLASTSARLSAVEAQAAQTASDAAFLKTIINSPIGSGTDSASLITDLEALDINTATVSGTLSVLGKTTLADIGITGNITAGILSIHGLTGEINTLGGPLQLQPLGIEPVEIMAGKVVIDTNGNIDTAGTLTAQKVNIPTTPANSASAGEGTITAATQQITINTHAVTAQSLIYITFTDDYAPAIRYWIESKVAGTSFTIKLDKTVTSNTKFNWWIVN